MTTVHEAAARGFDKGAEAYERGRPDYPEAAVAWLAPQLGLTAGSVVVDLAAGTGKLTRQLVPTGAKVVAVEPVAAMRTQLERAVPDVEVLDGTAEDMPLPDASVDAVTVGQAFHWFDAPVALAEIARVLRPAGGLGLIWNRRDLSAPLDAAVSEIMEPHRGTAPAHRQDRWRSVLVAEEGPFGPVEELRVPHEQRTDVDGLVDRVASTSFIAALPDDVRTGVLDRVRGLVAPGEVHLPLHYITEVFACHRR